MTLETLLDCQERGSNARILGAVAHENPYLDRTRLNIPDDERRLLRDAWNFGWQVEDAARQIGTGIYLSLRHEAALAAGRMAGA
ncbi:CrpP-related protein [Rhizobium helianthi]|uniref:CrpP-related protein n=1 Tax=Rhizobium helianthi TaxID=1132695 RepID=A0ABW4LY79_9HYPH